MRKAITAIALVVMLGMPSSAHISRTKQFIRMNPIPEEWTIDFAEEIRTCGDYSIYTTSQIIFGCTDFNKKIIFIDNFYLQFDIGFQIFDEVLMHEIGHVNGLQHGEKLNSFIEKAIGYRIITQ